MAWLVAWGLATSAEASILVSWNLAGNPGNQAAEPPAFSAAGIVGGPLVSGTRASPSPGDNTPEYLEFGFTVAPGITVDLLSLVIPTRLLSADPGTVELFTSLDGFTTAIHTLQPSETSADSVVDLTSLPALGAGAFFVRLFGTATGPDAAALPGIPGDYNGSGQVEQADLDLVLLNWGLATPQTPAGWTNDLPVGPIDQEELDKVLLNWGRTASSATDLAFHGTLGTQGPIIATPEASSLAVWAVLLIGACLCSKRIRRRP